MDSLEKLENSTNEWFRFGEIYYRKFSMIKFSESLKKLNFNACHIACCRNGGLMSFVRKTKHFIMDMTNPIKDSILTFYQNGVKEIEPIVWDDKTTIVLFEYTINEDLILLLSDGRLYNIDVFTKKVDYELIGFSFDSNPIIDAKLNDKSIMCLTEKGDFYYTHNYKEPSSFLFCNLAKLYPDFNYFNQMTGLGSINNKNSLNMNKKDSEYVPSDFLFIPPNHSSTGKIELYFPHINNGLLIFYEGENKLKYMKKNVIVDYIEKPLKGSQPQDVYTNEDLGKVIKFSLSPNFENLGIFNHLSQLFVFTLPILNNNDSIISNSSLTTLTQPYQFLWCAEDCLVVCSQGQVSLIGPGDIVKTFFIKNNCYGVSEIDGVRIILEDQIEFIQSVPQDLMDSIFPISINSSKKLLEAYKSFEDSKPDCDQELREIRSDLSNAITKLLSAASSQWDMSNQMYLLKAAQHGKTFVTKNEFSFNYFVSLCKDLRIINNLRTCEKPRLITYNQYKRMDLKNLVEKIMKMQNFHLAFEIYNYYGFNVNEVYENWALAFIRNLSPITSPEEELTYFDQINRKLSEVTGISYIKLAKESLKNKKEELGLKFLDKEKSVLAKIPQYVELKKWEQAISLSYDTKDYNMMFAVLDKIFKVENIDSFLDIVSKHKKSFSTTIDYLRNYHSEFLENFLNKNLLHEELFFLYLEQYFSSTNIKDKTVQIENAKAVHIKLMEKDKEEWKFYSSYLQDLENSIFLKKSIVLSNYVKTSDTSLFERSVYTLYSELISAEKVGFVEQKNKEYFDVNPKKINIIRMKCYAEENKVEAIKLLGNSVKSPPNIAFAEICIDKKINECAVDFLKKVNEEENFKYKISLLTSIERYDEALEAVIAYKDNDNQVDMVNDILNKAPQLQNKVSEYCQKYKVSLG